MRSKTFKSGMTYILTTAIIVGGMANAFADIMPLQMVYAEESSDSDFVIEDGVLVEYTGDGGDVVVPEGVTSIGGYAFSWCNSLTSIELPEGVTSIGDWAFEECSSLTSIELPEGVTSIGDWAFEGCSSLTSIEIPEGVTSIGEDAFFECSSLKNIEVNPANTTYQSVDGLLYKDTTLIQCPGGKDGKIELPEGVTSIGDWAFFSCSSLTSIELPKGVTSIGDYAFYCCSNLTSIELPEGVTSIGDGAFDGCSSLTNIEMNPANTTYQSVDGLLYKDTTLIRCPEGKDGKIKLPEWVTSIGHAAFFRCGSLTSIELPEGVTSIGDWAFSGCSGLTSIELPEGVTSIGDSAFYECSSLTSIELPEGVTSIGDSTFKYCSNLTSIELPEGVMSIGDSSFYECSSLTSVVIPKSVTDIGEYAFGYQYDDGWNKVLVEDFTIYGYTSTAAETYAEENNITFISVGDAADNKVTETEPEESEAAAEATPEESGVTVETTPEENEAAAETTPEESSAVVETNPEEKETTVEAIEDASENATTTDSENEIVYVSYDDTAFPGEKPELVVNAVTDEETYKQQLNDMGISTYKLYDIKLVIGGETVQPQSKITVSIKVPDDMNGENAKVYRLEEDGSLTDMEATYQDGFMVFTTSHFSLYVVTEQDVLEKPVESTDIYQGNDNNDADDKNTSDAGEDSPEQILCGDVNGDGVVNSKDSILIRRFLAGWSISIDETIADVNCDGVVNTKDVILVNRYVAGWNVTLGK